MRYGFQLQDAMSTLTLYPPLWGVVHVTHGKSSGAVSARTALPSSSKTTMSMSSQSSSHAAANS